MSRSVPDGPPPAHSAGAGSLASPYPAADWRLLVRLPGRVLTAALAGQADDPGGRVHSAVTGLAAIAAGRHFDSDLVRAVANAIYAEAGAPGAEVEAPGAGVEAPGRAPVDRGDRDGVLRACRTAVAVLDRADPADSAAYRQWVQSVAARTAGAASGFVADLGRALNLTVGR